MKAYIAGTCDTKGEELRYVRDLLEKCGLETCLIDVGTQSTATDVDVTAKEVAACLPGCADVLTLNDRGRSMAAMADAFAKFIATRKDVAGIIGLGGSGNTTLVTAGLRALPIGVPKVMVSTMASSNVSGYVGASDICMMYSVTDVAGINSISRVVLGNAAHALAGMIANRLGAPKSEKPAVAMTMFGVTTPCITKIRTALAEQYDCLVFHATGTGGRSMEKLIDSGMVAAAIDITTTEVADHLNGGIFSAGEDRLGAIIRTKIPYVGSVGAQDMVNFGTFDSVPEKFKQRNLYKHNPHTTLMRTTPEENTAIGRWIGEKLNACEGEVRFLLPEKGVSAIDAPGKPFHDSEADAALFAALEKTVRTNKRRQLIRIPHHINDDAFAAAAVEQFRSIVARASRP